MKLKNYTSSAPVGNSIARIEKLLAQAGASKITKDFKEGQLVGLMFLLPSPEGNALIRLPANVDACEDELMRDVRRPRDSTRELKRAQAERTVWKLLAEWVHIQISMIQLQQAEPLEIFTPYLFDGKTTFYRALKSGQQFKALPFAEEKK